MNLPLIGDDYNSFKVLVTVHACFADCMIVNDCMMWIIRLVCISHCQDFQKYMIIINGRLLLIETITKYIMTLKSSPSSCQNWPYSADCDIYDYNNLSNGISILISNNRIHLLIQYKAITVFRHFLLKLEEGRGRLTRVYAINVYVCLQS